MSNMTLGELFEYHAEMAVRKAREEQKQIIEELDRAAGKVAEPIVSNPTKIMEEEEANFPTFSNPIEAAAFFRQRYGDQFVIADVWKFSDGKITYECDLVFDPVPYYDYREKVYDGTATWKEEDEYLESFQRIEIYDNGEYWPL